ncbi:MAG: hypothetical protein M3N53_06205 [Actinomycetota bacterium]|nr:hypothetical protein [Actinomycetota bacterium]
MRKIIPTLIAALLSVSLAPTSGAAASDREVTKAYTMANGTVVYNSASAEWSIGTQYKVFRPQPGERFVSISVSDDAGQPVSGHVHIRREGKLDHVDFCNETQTPIELGAAKKVEIGVHLGTCSDATPSLVTQGTITATFSR